jgi:hypothetical protein
MKLDTTARKAGAIAFAVVALAAAGGLLWWHFRQPDLSEKYPQHVAAGHVLAEEVVNALKTSKKKRVLVIVGEGAPGIRVQLDALLAKLKEHPDIELKDGKPLWVDADEKHRFAPGQGLSARRFVRIVEHNLKADAMVSLVGAPNPDDPELKKLTTPVRRFIAEVGDRDRVQPLMDKQLLIVAVVPRFEFPAPVQQPKTQQEWFDKYFQVVRSPAATNKPPSKGKSAALTNTPAATAQ